MPERVLLTREERSRIVAGDFSPLDRDEEPTFKIGDGCVIVWSHARKFCDKEGHVFAPPSLPLLAIRVTNIVRKAKGGWAVRFEIFNRRGSNRLLRRTPPVYDSDLMHADQEQGLTAEQVAQARLETAYTSDPSAAVDHLAAVDDGYLAEVTTEARQVEALRERQDIGAEITRIESELPIEERVLELARLSRERGVDPRDDLKALERRLRRRLGLAA